VKVHGKMMYYVKKVKVGKVEKSNGFWIKKGGFVAFAATSFSHKKKLLLQPIYDR
jgi:predicted ribosome quality control (RQC) complex YloA/Tae2 family protein